MNECNKQRAVNNNMLYRLTYVDKLPPSFASIVGLLRRRMCLSRELVDDVVRARGERFVWFYSDDTPEHESVWIDGMLQCGRGWWRSGRLQRKTLYRNGVYHGFSRWWHENGTLRKEIPYVNNKRHGLAREWYDDGSLASTTDFVRNDMQFHADYRESAIYTDSN